MHPENKRVALVTGANRGIGFEISRQLALKGYTVLMGARDAQKGAAACEQLTRRKLDTHFILLDVTDPTMIQAALMNLNDTFGRLDVLVNNAGILIDADTPLLELGIPTLTNTLKTNMLGPLLLCQAAVPLMKQNRYGRIVNISSSLGSFSETTNPDSVYAELRSPAYRFSKILLNAMTVLLAKELQNTHILVNAACPGWVRTGLGGDRAPLTPEQAAVTPVWLATLPEGGPTGGFFREGQPIPW